jgi:hypothetical protein
MTESKSLRMTNDVIAPEFIEAGAKALAHDFDYLSQWDSPDERSNYTPGYWRELFTRAVEAGNAALACSATGEAGDGDQG